MTLTQLKHEVRRLNPNNVEENNDEFKVALLLLASIVIGPDERKLSRFTRLNRAEVEFIGANLRSSGVWKDGKVRCDWFDRKYGGTAFRLDIAVGMGLLTKIP
jgi:hypothetical protein